MKEKKGRLNGQFSGRINYGQRAFFILGIKSLENGFIYPNQLWPLIKVLRSCYKRNRLAYTINFFFFKSVSAKKPGIRMGASKGDLWRKAFLMKKGFFFIVIRTRPGKEHYFLIRLLRWLTKSLTIRAAVVVKKRLRDPS